MSDQKNKALSELDSIVECQLNLQVKISYSEHHDFLLRNGLKNCTQVLDVGTGNGAFAARLASDHPKIKFIGIDKRKRCIESAQKLTSGNFFVKQVDLFSRQSDFDFSAFDGFILRYFLLHVDHANKILDRLQKSLKTPAKFWIIDLDFAQSKCEPRSETFDRLIGFIKEFCTKTSIETLGGANAERILNVHGFRNVIVENAPFSSSKIPLNELSLYLKQEVLCYSRMSGRAIGDSETLALIKFINEDIQSGKFQISYGMKLISAEF